MTSMTPGCRVARDTGRRRRNCPRAGCGIARALDRERRHEMAVQDAAIYAESGDDADMIDLVQIPVGHANGLGHDSVVNCDTIVTIPRTALGEWIGHLLPTQETALTAAIQAAFDLE
jgi:hypothetical protein